MGSLGTGEILVIVLVAIIVFGPHRLPEISRKAGELLAKARQMASSVTQTIDAEYGDLAAPIKDLKGEYDATMSDVKGAASTAAANLSVDIPKVEMPSFDLKKAVTGSTNTNDSKSADGAAEPAPTAADAASNGSSSAASSEDGTGTTAATGDEQAAAEDEAT